MDTLNTDAWIGQQVVETGRLDAVQAAHVHAAIGDGAAPSAGDALPPLWHWCAFPNAAPNEMLKQDGHIQGGALLPPLPYPRRMWAAGALTFHRNIHVGETLERRSHVRAITEKTGGAGPMVFVTLDHAIYGDNGLAIEERQDIVFLQIPQSFSPPPKSDMPDVPCERIATAETLLFRYSAITFNAHRIHYDLPYTQEVEKYPGLIVHGPLQASLLMRAAMRTVGRPPMFFDFRGVHPMFAGPTCDLAMQHDDEGLQLWAGQSGHQCMRARAVWEQTQ